MYDKSKDYFGVGVGFKEPSLIVVGPLTCDRITDRYDVLLNAVYLCIYICIYSLLLFANHVD